MIKPVMAENGGCYRAKVFWTAVQELDEGRDLFTGPTRPAPNAMEERFIRTAKKLWANTRPTALGASVSQ